MHQRGHGFRGGLTTTVISKNRADVSNGSSTQNNSSTGSNSSRNNCLISSTDHNANFRSNKGRHGREYLPRPTVLLVSATLNSKPLNPSTTQPIEFKAGQLGT